MTFSSSQSCGVQVGSGWRQSSVINHWIGLISISPVTPEAFELFDRIKIRSWIFKFDVLFIYPNPWVFLVIANLVGSINLEEDGILAGSLPALGLIVPR